MKGEYSLKKIISLIILICSIICFSPSVSMDTVYADDEKISDSINLLGATELNISFGSDYTAEVSRSDFLCAVMNLIKSLPSTQKNYSFTDVESYPNLIPYLEHAIRLGIIVDSAAFEPDRAITINEAMKILVVALGYASEAHYYGGYPTGYLYTASGILSLSKNINYNLSSDALTAGNSYILLKNFCEAPLRIQTGAGKTNSYETNTDKTILTEYFNLYKINGIIEADAKTSLFGSSDLNDNCVKINNATFLCEIPYTLGASITGYAAKDDNIDKITYLKEKNNNTLSLTSDEITSSSLSSLNYLSGDITSTLKLSIPVSFIYNGKAYNEYTAKDLQLPMGKYTFIDNNGDKTYDVVLCSNSEVFYIDKISKSNLSLYDSNTGKSISIKNIKNNITFNDKPCNFDDILPGSIASYAFSKDGEYLKLDISSKNISGTVNEIDTLRKKITIENTEYDYTDYFGNIFLASTVLGGSYTFILTSDGDIASKYKADSQTKFGYLFKAYKEKGILGKVSLKIYTGEAQPQVFTLADKINFNDESKSSEYVYDAFSNNSKTVEQVISFSLDDKKEKIVKINTESDRTGYFDDTTDSPDSLIRYSFNGDTSNVTDITYKGNGLFVPYFTISNSTIIFNIVNDPDLEDTYRCSNKLNFSNDKKVAGATIKPYNVSKAGTAKILLYINNEAATGSSFSDEPPNGLVSSYKKIIDEEGTPMNEIGVYTSGSVFEYYKADNTVLSQISVGKDGQPIHPGDYIRFEANAKKEITAIEKDFDAETMTLLHSATSHNTILRYYYANVFSIDNVTTSFLSIGGDPNEKFVLKTNGPVAKFNIKDKKVSPATLNDIITYTQSTDSCSNILIRSRYAVMTNIVIYE